MSLLNHIKGVFSRTNANVINGNKLILDADGDTSITADTDDQIDIEVAGADDFRITANTLTALSGSSVVVASGDVTLSAGDLSVEGDINQTDGGAVTQITDDSTGVELNTRTGAITTVALTLAAGADTSFTLTNSTIGANSAVIVWGKVYGGTADGIISAQVEEVAAGSCVINVQNIGGASLDALAVIGFMVLGGSVT